VLRGLGPQHQVVLINFEGLAWLFEKKERLKLLGADMLVVDESSKIKNSTSVRFRALKPNLIHFAYRHILTGSPRPRNYEDLFGQIYVLDRGATLGSYITHYRNRYFYPTGFEMREWVLLPGKDKEINRLLAPMILRLDARDHLKLPSTPEQTHKITLPEKVQEEYDP
jgi:SNF2 family DNA or RNA helicase